jgi:hypothetical protein
MSCSTSSISGFKPAYLAVPSPWAEGKSEGKLVPEFATSTQLRPALICVHPCASVVNPKIFTPALAGLNTSG